MTLFVQYVLSGIALGAIYGLIALAFSMIYKTSDVLNFATGVLIVFGAYVTAKLAGAGTTSFVVGALIAIAATAILAMVLERLFVRPMLGKSVVSISIMTLGLFIIGTADLTHRIGTHVLPLGDPWGAGIAHPLGLDIPNARVAAIVVGLALMVIFFVWLKYSRWGIAMRAMAEDRPTASLMGVRLDRVSMMAWGIAGGLASVAGVFLATFPSSGVDGALSDTALRAFPAAILGGIDSTTGAVAGGFILGVVEVLTRGYQHNLSFLGQGFHEVAAYLVLLIVLLIRPAGLFGTRDMNRV